MVSEQDKCPIWDVPATRLKEDYGNVIHVDSPRAGGRYTIFKQVGYQAGGLDQAHKALLTTWIIDQHIAGIDDPQVERQVVEEVAKRRPLSVIERAERLLKLIQSLSRYIGYKVILCPDGQDDGMLAWSESLDMIEVNYLLEYLCNRQFLEKTFCKACDVNIWDLVPVPTRHTSSSSTLKSEEGQSFSTGRIRRYAITPEGYAHLTSRAADTACAFVAMWFDSSLDEAYEYGMRPAIEDAGYSPLRMDRKDHNNKIDDEIIAEIRRSRFLVADFTQGEAGARGGVYYEAGFAHGLNIPVIFACRKDVIDKVHFDTRQYNHIVWDTPDALRDKLAKRISATIGDGPYKKLNI